MFAPLTHSPFGALEAMLAQHTIRHLSNASATWWPGGQGVGAAVTGLRVIHDREQGQQEGHMVNDFNPVATLLASQAPGLRRGDALQITPDAMAVPGPVYRVERADADGRGLVRVDLSTL